MSNPQDKYKDYSKEELIEELETLKKKKYGLVWDRKNSQELLDAFVNWENMPEKFIPKTFPVLKEVKKLEIQTDKNKPANLLIEGDNYHSLAVLSFTHKNLIDLIYIDPPYNTGHEDFVYNDKFVDREDPWRHSKWLSFMDKRLRLARDLLKPTGSIFINIDDNEFAQLKLLCDEIFGEENFINTICWKSRHSISNDLILSPNHNFILLYAKDSKLLFKRRKEFRLEKEFVGFSNPDNDPKGPWKITPVDGPGGARKGNPYYEFLGIKGYWRYSQDTMQELYENGEIIKRGKSLGRKYYLSHAKENGGSVATTWWDDAGTTTEGTNVLRDILGEDKFNNPKPISLIKRIIQLGSDKDGIILDFMAGSGTTGHAVLDLNNVDDGNRQFILCTNNENNICSDVCYPRLKKVITGYKNNKGESVPGLGGNLKYFQDKFVGSQPTDKNKRDLVNNSSEILSIKEGIFDLLVDNGSDFHIYKNENRYLGIIFNEEAIDRFILEANKLDGHFSIYCFSYSEAAPTKEFEGMSNKFTLQPIPEIILKVYREIFKK